MTTTETTGRWRAFEGANGWYVAWERPDGYHHQPAWPHWLSRAAARLEAAQRNDEEGTR